MRSALVSALLLVASLGFAQTGFTTHTYSAPYDTHLIQQDLNRDGAPDLVLFGGPLVVELNDGHGNFGNQHPVGVTADKVAIADFNKDGLPDIASCVNSSTANSATVQIFLNRGSGAFAKSYSTTVPFACANVVAGDINRDGKPDLVVAGSVYSSAAQNNLSYLYTFFGDGAGKLGTPVVQQPSLAAQKNPQGIIDCYEGPAVGADFTGTGRFDLILFGDCNGDFVTNAGTLYYAQSSTSGHYTLTEILEDVRQFDYNLPYVSNVKGYGLPDVIVIDDQTGPHGSWVTNLDFLVNEGGEKFSLKNIFDENSYAASYDPQIFSGAAANFNGDNYWDAIVGFAATPAPCCTPTTPTMAILLGKGSYTYAQPQQWTLSGDPYATITADFNRDGHPDIATLTHNNSTNTSSLKVYLSGGTSTSCAAPSSPGVHVCAPVANGTYSSPVTVIAAGKGASGTVSLLELWIDGKKIGNYSGSTMNTKVSLAAGSHSLTIVELDSKGGYVKSTPVNITVK